MSTEDAQSRSLQDVDGRTCGTETVKERRWWEVKTWDSDAGCWRNAGNSPLREEIDRFIARAQRENFAVQVWEAVAVERTNRVKQLETGSPVKQIRD
jgi:hypothetical protein